MPAKQAEKTRNVSCLPSCFGFDGGVSDRGTKEKHEFSWWRSRMRKSGMKTVPVDVAIAQKGTRGNFNGAGVEEKIAWKRRVPGKKKSPVAGVEVPEDHQGAVRKSKKPKNGNGQIPTVAQIHVLESRRTYHTGKDHTCQRSARTPRRTESQPSSPPSTTTAPSSPFLPPTRRRTTHPSRLSGQKHDRKNAILAGKFDPVVGMSVLMVILAIMLLWGRMCAIVCTSAWFYFIPRLRNGENSVDDAGKRPETGKPDIDSEEYKKKVILEGLLDRNRRNPVVIL